MQFFSFSLLFSRIVVSKIQKRMVHREVICADTTEWLKDIPASGFGEKTSVFTSLPDISEMPQIYHGERKMEPI
jgi:hypothetical protein